MALDDPVELMVKIAEVLRRCDGERADFLIEMRLRRLHAHGQQSHGTRIAPRHGVAAQAAAQHADAADRHQEPAGPAILRLTTLECFVHPRPLPLDQFPARDQELPDRVPVGPDQQLFPLQVDVRVFLRCFDRGLIGPIIPSDLLREVGVFRRSRLLAKARDRGLESRFVRDNFLVTASACLGGVQQRMKAQLTQPNLHFLGGLQALDVVLHRVAEVGLELVDVPDAPHARRRQQKGQSDQRPGQVNEHHAFHERFSLSRAQAAGARPRGVPLSSQMRARGSSPYIFHAFRRRNDGAGDEFPQ